MSVIPINWRFREKSALLKWCLLAVVVCMAVLGWRVLFGRLSFDADKVGCAETRMWRAYYTGDEARISLNLILLLRRQHGLSLPEATRIGEFLARSAMKFKSAKGNYQEIVLPELTEAYRRVKHVTNAPFDPEQAARAELAWWVARRTPGQNSPAQVGEKIAELYAVLYGREHPSLRRAGLLRAQAAALRDSGGKNADWSRIEELLRESYRELKKGI